jgi:AraC-like DNA-binding protein
MRKNLVGKISCAALLISISGLQLGHFLFFSNGADLLNDRVYLYLLLFVPMTFYFFSRVVLFPETKLHMHHFLHLLPLLIGFLVPLSIIPVTAFLIGTGYTFWFARIVFQLRAQRNRFKFEIFFGLLFALMALLALLLGFSIPYIDHAIFYSAYAGSIGIAMLLVTAAIIIFPELLRDISDITEIAYSNSTLGSLDINSIEVSLDKLMLEDKIYQNENLSLSILAEMLGVTSHQLSELINTQFGYGFPRFIREKRVSEAKQMLLDEPSASVLSVGMATGFKSQSNFYSAFREITGMSPGNYRKNTTSDS